MNESKKMNIKRTTKKVLLSVCKGRGLYLYIAQVDLEESSRVGSLCICKMYDVGLV